MNDNLAPIAYCAKICGLNRKEMLVGVILSSKHEQLLEKYNLDQPGDDENACSMIVADIREALRQDDPTHAADLLLVLRLFLAERKRAAKSGTLVPQAATAIATYSHRAERSVAGQHPFIIYG
jgi:hypothetical protein